MADTLDSWPGDGAGSELVACFAMAKLVEGAEDLHRWHRKGHSGAVLPVSGGPCVTRLPAWPSATVFGWAGRHLSAPLPPKKHLQHFSPPGGPPGFASFGAQTWGAGRTQSFPLASIPPEQPASVHQESCGTCLSTAACHMR